MLENNGHIDKMFSEKLKDLSVQPRPELWSNINSGLKHGRRKKRTLILFASLAVAGSLALLFVLSNAIVFQDNDGFNKDEMISELKNNELEFQKVFIPVTSEREKRIVKKRNSIKEPKIREINHKESLANNHLIAVNSDEKREIVMHMALSKIQLSVSKNKVLSMNLTDDNEIENKDISKAFSTNDSLIIARNLKMLNQFDDEGNKKKAWSILGQVSSAYSSYNGKKSGNNSENGLISFGGGVKLNWQAGKRMAIQTGVIYNRFGQELAGRTQSFENAMFSDELSGKANIGVETSAGEINFKSSPKLNDENQYLSAELGSSPNMIQSFEAIEIPLIIKYRLIDKKIGLHLSGGFSTNLMIGNRVYDKNTNETLGETSGIRSTNFSTSFSFGIEYQLNSKFSLSMEPAFKYYLNSINTNSNFNYKPYSIGLSSGIRYKF